MNKIPLYSLNQQFYLYFDTDDKRFYRALNQSIYDVEKEKDIHSKIVHFRKLFPLLIPVSLLLGAYLSSDFVQWTTTIFNGGLLLCFTFISMGLIFTYAKKLKERMRVYYQNLDYFLVEYSPREIEDVILKTKIHYQKVLVLRLSFILATLLLGIVFLLSSYLLVLVLYVLMFFATSSLFIITTAKSYPILRKLMV